MPVMHHHFTALPPDRALRAMLPQLHLPQPPKLPVLCFRGQHLPCAPQEAEEQPQIVSTAEAAWSTSTRFFLAHDHITSSQDQITKDVSCPCKILTQAQVWS